MASQLAGLVAALAVLAVCPAISMTEPSDEEIVRRCGFSLNAIHECKYSECLRASEVCGETSSKEDANDPDCQMRVCMRAKTECEAPLNNGLSPAEVCEGDGFDRVDTDCLLYHRRSLLELTDCKTRGYLAVKRECFSHVWSESIRTQAETLLKRSHVSDELVECALSSCFNSTGCFQNYEQQMALNPAAHRTFNLTLCAYVSPDYPRECDHRNCTLHITACKHLEPPGMAAGAVAAVVLVVLVVPVVLVVLLLIVRSRRSRCGSRGERFRSAPPA